LLCNYIMNLERKTKQLGIIIFFVLILTLRRDGYFPFSSQLSETTYAWVSFGQVLLFALILFLFFYPKNLLNQIWRFLIENLRVIAIVLAGGLISTIWILLCHEARVFKEYYNWNSFFTMIMSSFCFLIIVIPLILKKAKVAILALFTSTFLISLIPIIYFSVTAKISDLLPIVIEQLGAFIKGENIYQYYLLDNGTWTQAVRQPGTTLSFLPAFLLNIDLRYMSIVFTLLTGFILFRIVYKKFGDTRFNKKFLVTYVSVLLFLLFPYRHLRADLYEPAFWFLLSLSLYFLKNKRLKLFSITWGLGIFTQVWFWLFSPFVSLFLLRKYGWKKALFYSLIYLIIGAGLLSIFILPDTPAYYEHVFSYYRGVVERGEFSFTSIYLSPLFMIYGLNDILTIVQVIAVGLVGVVAIFRLKAFKDLLKFLIIAFFVFIQFNSLSWNYMYVNLVVLLVIYLLSSVDTTKEEGSIVT
jgi:hypothetical protein